MPSLHSVLGFALAGAMAASAAAQTSRLYTFTMGAWTGDAACIMFQGGSRVDDFPLVDFWESAGVVIDGSVRTFGTYGGQTGHEYTLDGVPTGAAYPNPIGGGACCYFTDAAIDPGGHIYAMRYLTGEVWIFGPDWDGGVILFDTQNNSDAGLAYDQANDILWISRFNDATIRGYSRAGELKRSITIQDYSNFYLALAWDPADQTLWTVQMALGQPSHMQQYDPDSGARLQNLDVPGGFHSGLAGAEFGPGEPPCIPDFDSSGQLDLFDFLAFTNLFNAADPKADCDHDGAFTLFDFLCFTNAFNAGC